jgi:PhzF family phenazine biosynthesis protein
VNLRQWSVDALASQPFKGNQACVVEPFDAWPDVAWMQALAAENAAGATAYLTRTADVSRFGLRWFAPKQELPLCGHGTFAAAHVLFAECGLTAGEVVFETGRGALTVTRAADGYRVDFPATRATQISAPAGLAAALGAAPMETWASDLMIVRLADEAAVVALDPNLPALMAASRAACGGAGNLGVFALARDKPYQVISRFFAPGYGLSEDPATGSWHCVLAPIAAALLGRDRLSYFQAFPRRGAELVCEVVGERVLITAPAVTIAQSRLRL